MGRQQAQVRSAAESAAHARASVRALREKQGAALQRSFELQRESAPLRLELGQLKAEEAELRQQLHREQAALERKLEEKRAAAVAKAEREGDAEAIAAAIEAYAECDGTRRENQKLLTELEELTSRMSGEQRDDFYVPSDAIAILLLLSILSARSFSGGLLIIQFAREQSKMAREQTV